MDLQKLITSLILAILGMTTATVYLVTRNKPEHPAQTMPSSTRYETWFKTTLTLAKQHAYYGFHFGAGNLIELSGEIEQTPHRFVGITEQHDLTTTEFAGLCKELGIALAWFAREEEALQIQEEEQKRNKELFNALPGEMSPEMWQDIKTGMQMETPVPDILPQDPAIHRAVMYLKTEQPRLEALFAVLFSIPGNIPDNETPIASLSDIAQKHLIVSNIFRPVASLDFAPKTITPTRKIKSSINFGVLIFGLTCVGFLIITLIQNHQQKVLLQNIVTPCKLPACDAPVFVNDLCREHFNKLQEETEDEIFFG